LKDVAIPYGITSLQLKVLARSRPGLPAWADGTPPRIEFGFREVPRAVR